jgi:hypothetical protein
MLDAITMYVKRLFPIRTIEGALSQFISPKLITACNSTRDESGCLLSIVSQAAQRDPLDTLYEVADRLDLTPCYELNTPSRELVSLSGHSSETLREVSVMPQGLEDGREGYCLVVADPESVDIREYEEKGIVIIRSIMVENYSCG